MKRVVLRLSFLVFLFALAGVVFAGGQAEQGREDTGSVGVEEADPEAFSMAVIFAGLTDDGGFNEVGLQGLQELQESQDIKVTYVESVDDVDATNTLGNFAEAGYDLVYAWSGGFQSSVFQVAPDYPDTTFAAFAGPQMSDEAPDNVWISGNAFEDAFFLAGALAGLMTQSDVLGYVGGVEIPVYKASAEAFEDGATYVNEDVTVYTTFVGDFNDPSSAREGARGILEAGADIVLGGVNEGIFGVIPPAEEAGAKVIGMSKDQNDLAPETILTSIVKDYKGVMETIVNRVRDGETNGYEGLSLVDGTVRLAPFRGMVPEEVIGELERIEELLREGEVDFTTAADL